MESRRRREGLIEDALETFAVYDDLAKRDTLDEIQAFLGVEIDEADVEAELSLLQSSSLEDVDDTESGPGTVDADPGPDDADPDAADAAFDAADAAFWTFDDDDAEALDDDGDTAAWSYLTEDYKSEMSSVADDVDASINADTASEAPLHTLEQELQARLKTPLTEYRMTAEEEKVVRSVILSDRMPTDIDDGGFDAEDDDDSGRTTSVDLVEDFVNEMTAAHACARASANSADMTDVDVDAIQPLMGALDARTMMVRVLAWRRHKRKREARVAAKRSIQSLGNRKHGNHNRASVIDIYPNIVDTIGDIVAGMNLGASAHRDSSALIQNTHRKMEKGTGWERIRLELQRRGIRVSTTTVRHLCLARRSKTVAAQRHLGLVAVKCRRSVKRLGRFNLDAHARNAFYRTIHYIRDRTPADKASLLERDDKAKTRMNSGESTCKQAMVGDAAGESSSVVVRLCRSFVVDVRRSTSFEPPLDRCANLFYQVQAEISTILWTTPSALRFTLPLYAKRNHPMVRKRTSRLSKWTSFTLRRQASTQPTCMQ